MFDEWKDQTPDEMGTDTPAIIARLYRNTGFGRLIDRMVVLDWPQPEIVTPNPIKDPIYEGEYPGPLTARMQVSTWRVTRGRQLARVTAEWYWRMFHEEPRNGLRRTDMTIAVVFCDYEEAY